MKIQITILLLGLGLIGCEKETQLSSENNDDLVVVNGKVYSIKQTQARIGYFLHIDKDEFTFNRDSLGFERINSSGIYKIETFVESLNIMEERNIL